MAKKKILDNRGAVLQDYQTQADQTEQIRKIAKDLYEKRGRQPGHEMDDWLQAEKMVKKQAQGKSGAYSK